MTGGVLSMFAMGNLWNMPLNLGAKGLAVGFPLILTYVYV